MKDLQFNHLLRLSVLILSSNFGCVDELPMSMVMATDVVLSDAGMSEGANDADPRNTGDAHVETAPMTETDALPEPERTDEEPNVSFNGEALTRAPMALYEPSEGFVTRGFVQIKPFLVVEFTAQCGERCPDDVVDGDVGLDSWRFEFDAFGQLSNKVRLDRIVLDNTNAGAFDQSTTRSSMLYYNAGRIFRETHARFYGPSSMTGRGMHFVEFDPLLGTFGTFYNGTEVSESVVEPTYVKESELGPAPEFDHLSRWFYLTQPFIQGFHAGTDGLGTAHLSPLFENEELVWLRGSSNFSDEEAQFWSDQGQRMVTFVNTNGLPQPAYSGTRIDQETPMKSLSERLTSILSAQYPDAIWRGRLEVIHQKRAHLLTAQAPITGTWNGAPAALIADGEDQTLSIQRFETKRVAALGELFDNGLSQAVGNDLVERPVKHLIGHIAGRLDANVVLMAPIVRIVEGLPAYTLNEFLEDALLVTGDSLLSGESVGDYLLDTLQHRVMKLAQFNDEGQLEANELQFAEAVLARIFGEVTNAEALTELMSTTFETEREGLSGAEERQRLARRVIRPFSRYSDGPVQTLGEFIDELVDDPVTQLVGNSIGAVGAAMELALTVTGLGQFDNACGVLPTDAEELADGMFGVHGAGLDRANMVFIEAMKLLEYESKVNYSFAERLSDVVRESHRLDERLAPLVGDAIHRLLGKGSSEQTDSFANLYARRIRFEAFVAKVVRDWIERQLRQDAPELFEMTASEVQAGDFERTLFEAIRMLPNTEALFERTVLAFMPEAGVLDEMATSLLSEILTINPWLRRDHQLDLSLSEVIYREVLRDPQFSSEIGEFVTNVMGAFVDGWLLNSGIAEIASDEVRLARGDCIGVWLTTLKRAKRLFAEETDPARIINAGIVGLEFATHKMRKAFFTAAVGGIVSPLVIRHRKSALSYVRDVAAEPNQVVDLEAIFGVPVNGVEVFPSDYGMVIFGHRRVDDQLTNHLAVLHPENDLVEQFELPPGVEPRFGVQVMGSEFIFGTRAGGEVIYRSLSLINGRIKRFVSQDEGILTEIESLHSTNAQVMRVRNEPFDGPLTSQAFGDGVYTNGHERAFDGMLYIVSE